MSEYACFLITLCDGKTLARCAIKIHRDMLSEDCQEFPMEPQNILVYENLLPDHAKSFGAIVKIEYIFEVITINQKGQHDESANS